jgi:hypothetical protein
MAIQRLVQLYSAQDLTGLSAMERAAQEQEMMSVYWGVGLFMRLTWLWLLISFIAPWGLKLARLCCFCLTWPGAARPGVCI